MRDDIASTSTVDPTEQPAEPPSPSSNLLHPADPARVEQISRPTTPDPTEHANSDAEAIGLGVIPETLRSRSSSPVPPVSVETSEPVQSSSEDAAVVVDSSSTPSGPTATSSFSDPSAPPIPPRPKSSLPFSTFQQLPFIPKLPSSLLSAAWIIPRKFAARYFLAPLK